MYVHCTCRHTLFLHVFIRFSDLGLPRDSTFNFCPYCVSVRDSCLSSMVNLKFDAHFSTFLLWLCLVLAFGDVSMLIGWGCCILMALALGMKNYAWIKLHSVDVLYDLKLSLCFFTWVIFGVCYWTLWRFRLKIFNVPFFFNVKNHNVLNDALS